MLLFIDQVDQLMREGLARSYRGHEANLRQFRGRLLVKDHLRENLLHRERFFTAHAIFDEDNTANATLREALVAVSHCAIDGDIADRSRRFLSVFPEVKPRRRKSSVLPHTRSLARYADALTLARWILDHFVPSPTGGTEHAFVYLVDMNVLFQEFVATILKRLASSTLQVASQARCTFWPEEQASRRGLRPDLLVTVPLGNLVIDTKWKAHGIKAPSDEDLRQVFVYCEYFAAKRGVLLYPKAGNSPPPKVGTFVDRSVRCELQYLDLFDGNGDFDPAGVREQLRVLTAQH
jgi:5-methylcytosine-specific restriction enzyme subunit McrC